MIKRIVFILLFLHLTTVVAYASECYTSIPNLYVYTDMGYIWYKQSNYNDEDSVGYCDGIKLVWCKWLS